MKVKVTFQAQEWYQDQAHPADREPNRVTFTIPLEDAVPDSVEDIPTDPNEIYQLLPKDDSTQSDVLAEHENAPDWVTEWAIERENPFYVQTELI